MVSMARALIANLDLLELFRAGHNGRRSRSAAPTATNAWAGRSPARSAATTATLASEEKMQEQILCFNRADPA
jgi:hypothetical protein